MCQVLRIQEAYSFRFALHQPVRFDIPSPGCTFRFPGRNLTLPYSDPSTRVLSSRESHQSPLTRSNLYSQLSTYYSQWIILVLSWRVRKYACTHCFIECYRHPDMSIQKLSSKPRQQIIHFLPSFPFETLTCETRRVPSESQSVSFEPAALLSFLIAGRWSRNISPLVRLHWRPRRPRRRRYRKYASCCCEITLREW